MQYHIPIFFETCFSCSTLYVRFFLIDGLFIFYYCVILHWMCTIIMSTIIYSAPLLISFELFRVFFFSYYRLWHLWYVQAYVAKARVRWNCWFHSVHDFDVTVPTYSVIKCFPTLCNPMDCSLPASSVHGISQARTLEWLPFPLPEVPTQGLNSSLLCLPHCQVDSLPLSHLGSPLMFLGNAKLYSNTVISIYTFKKSFWGCQSSHILVHI